MSLNFRKLSLGIILIALFIAPRAASLNTFVTVDEPFWLSVGANFYYALGQREFQKTVYEYHPAVTTMWFVTAGMLATFPEYRGFGQGYFDVDKDKFDPFLLEHGVPPMHLLVFSRIFQLALIALLLLAIFHLLSFIVGDAMALLVAGLISSAPFFMGHSLLLNHEALLATCALTSIFGMLVYLDYGRKWPYLLISAAAASLAQLTKSSAVAILPVIGLILVVSTVRQWKSAGFKRAVLDHLGILGIWLIALVFVYFIIWPGMWVAPGRMLYEVYGNAFSYAFQGARLQVTEELQPAKFSLDAAGPVIRSFISNLIWRSTPLTWLGVLVGILGFTLRNDFSQNQTLKRALIYLSILFALFVLMFALAQGRNQLHYIMTSFISLDAFAGLGWSIGLSWLAYKWKFVSRTLTQVALICVLLALQLSSTLSFRPYFYTYINPWMSKLAGGRPGYGYGEGMELAAGYLAEKPDADALTVLAYHGRGPFSYFFPGNTLLLNPLWLEEPGMVPMLERLVQSDYLVFYDEFASRSERTRQFVEALEGIPPQEVLSVQDLERILIYRVADFPETFYDAIETGG